MTTAQQTLIDTLKKNSLSVTGARQLVFNSLLHQEPLTMAEVVLALQGKVDRASVYRCIDLYEKLGIVMRLTIGWKYKIELSGDYHEHHHHMSCLSCGTLVSIEGDSHIEDDIVNIAAKHNFIIARHQVEIQGYCRNCSPSHV